MARTTIALKNGNTTIAPGPNVAMFHFINVGMAGGDAGTQAATVQADVGSISASGTTMNTQYGSILAQMGTVVTNAGGSAAALGVTALNTMVNTGSADLVSLLALVATGSADATTLGNASTADVVISFNTANITTVSQLRRAFDKAIDLALGGVGGLTAP